MTPRLAVVLALAEPEQGSLASRLPSYLHPASGRPLIWHTLAGLIGEPQAPREIVVLTPPGTPENLLDDLSAHIQLGTFDPSSGEIPRNLASASSGVLLVHASASLDTESLHRLLASPAGSWVGETPTQAAAVLLDAAQLEGLLLAPEPFRIPNGFLSPLGRVGEGSGAFVVSTRSDLARRQRRICDRLVHGLMETGVTFLLPETVLVDVDVRIGRDTVVYPGAILEGQTTIGDETVIGPGCRVIDSWIGSGVELKGWNYVANTSVRNRAILEPYVRRGFD